MRRYIRGTQPHSFDGDVLTMTALSRPRSQAMLLASGLLQLCPRSHHGFLFRGQVRTEQPSLCGLSLFVRSLEALYGALVPRACRFVKHCLEVLNMHVSSVSYPKKLHQGVVPGYTHSSQPRPYRRSMSGRAENVFFSKNHSATKEYPRCLFMDTPVDSGGS